MFVTMACVVLDGESGELRYASAGHEPPLLRRLGGATTVLAVEGGAALGLDAGLRFPVWTGQLAPGDMLVLYTDGVTEAFDADGATFGLERMRRVVAETPPEALGTLPARLVKAVERFSERGGPRDDLAVLAVQYRPADGAVDPGGAESWRLSIDSEPESVGQASRWLEGILRSRDIPPATVHECGLVVEELLTNVTIHAYDGEPGREARVGLRLLPDEIEIRIEDTGPPFNPLDAPPPDLDAPLAERPVGGLGLVLVRQFVSRWSYAREGSTNVLTFHRSRPVPAADGAPLRAAASTGQGGVMELQIDTTSRGPAERRVALRGRLDTLTAPKLEAELAPVLESPAVTSLVFELAGLEYISSAGIRCIVRARKAIEGRGGKVALVNPQPAVLRVFEIVKALPSEQVFGSQAELDAYLDAMQRRVRGQH
jgi:anti-anti-sigma factor